MPGTLSSTVSSSASSTTNGTKPNDTQNPNGAAPHPKSLNPVVDCSEATRPDDELDAWAWWRRDDSTGLYTDLSTGLDALATILKTQGPFAGVIGFSQGAAAAAMLASLLEPGRRGAFAARAGRGEGMAFPKSFVGRESAEGDADTDGEGNGDGSRLIHPPLRFAVCYSGFVAPHLTYAAFYEPRIRTPVLHFIGSLDTVVEEGRSLKLVEACMGRMDEEGQGSGKTDGRGMDRVVRHPGGHFLPTQKVYLNALVGFMREALAEGPVAVRGFDGLELL